MYAKTYFTTGMSGGCFITRSPEEVERERRKNMFVPTQMAKPKLKFKKYQLRILEEEFQKGRVLGPARKADLATMLNVTESCVRHWFKNRRSKQKLRDLQKSVKVKSTVKSGSIKYIPSLMAQSVATQFPFGSSTDLTLLSPNSESGSTQFPLCSSTNLPQISPIPEPESTQFPLCSSTNLPQISPIPEPESTQFPFCSSTYPPQISLISETGSTQFSLYSPSPSIYNTQPITYNTQAPVPTPIESIGCTNVSSLGEIFPPVVESAYIQYSQINSTLNSNISELGSQQLSIKSESQESAEIMPYVSNILAEQNDNCDGGYYPECIDWCEMYNSIAGMEQMDAAQTNPAIKWNSSGCVADSEINSPLDFFDMFHSY